MPVVLFVAFAGSLLIHGAALFGSDFELFGEEPETMTLHAELRLPPPPPVEVSPQPAAKPPARPRPKPSPKPPAKPQAPVVAAETENVPEAAGGDEAQAADAAPPEADGEAVAAAAPPPEPEPEPEPEPPAPVLPASGTIRFTIIMGAQGFRIGRAEHHWEFAEDGGYRLRAVSETNGLAALFRPVRVETESRGRLLAGGLRPEVFRSRREGGGDEEGADFDWAAGEVHMLRNGRTHRLTTGAQDLLSLPYQLAYLGHLAEGAGLSVATTRKFEWQRLDALGEEVIEVPAGNFRTLHLRAASDSATEVWIALDHGGLPVKIRFTDKKGDSFEQVATDLGF
ncbi:MAG: DUF3108 domain-containing protein [Betaproteobacteria bacterium]|nr:DUF3108 domain-containing protein [Betaproteobacteria bacterium]MCL2885836.1 DUF3108 domain-containing protein [Betaproteobacteria bacterium]